MYTKEEKIWIINETAYRYTDKVFEKIAALLLDEAVNEFKEDKVITNLKPKDQSQKA